MSEKTSLEDNGIYIFQDDVNDKSCEGLIKFVLEQNCQPKKKDELTIIVNSPGGYVHCAFAMIDVIHSSKIPIHTVGIGLVASAGLMLFMTGHRRTLTPNTEILSHQFSGWAFGKYHELQSHNTNHDEQHAKIIKHYIRHTKLKSKSKIEEYLLRASDTWLTADECKKYGLCDEVKDFTIDRIPSVYTMGSEDIEKALRKKKSGKKSGKKS